MSLRLRRPWLVGFAFAALVLSGAASARAWECDGPGWQGGRGYSGGWHHGWHAGWHKGWHPGWRPDFGYRPPPGIYYAPGPGYPPPPPPPPPPYYGELAYVPY